MIVGTVSLRRDGMIDSRPQRHRHRENRWRAGSHSKKDFVASSVGQRPDNGRILATSAKNAFM